MTCPRNWEVRAEGEGRLGASDVAALERHAETCAECRRDLAAGRELRELAKRLPAHTPTELEARRLRARILRDAMAPRAAARRPLRSVMALVAAALVIGLLLARFHRSSVGPSNDDRLAGTIEAGPGSIWTQARHSEVERVLLRDGDLTIHVRKQKPSERFIVALPDGEVEVRGTVFEVSVHEAVTQRVHVDEGVVEVRIDGTSTLSAGQTWSRPSDLPFLAPTPSASVEASPPSPGAPTARDLPAPTASLRPPSRRTESRQDAPVADADAAALPAYERAVDAYRAQRFEAAVDLFHAFVVEHPTSSFLDDASFLEASSLAEAGRGDAAALVAERHLERFPASFHRKDASILVARLRRSRGDCEGARRVLAPWAHGDSTEPSVVAALRGCPAP